VCVDIGGGTTRIGFSNDGKSFDEIEKFPTFEEFDEVVSKIIEIIKHKKVNPERVSIAAPGSIDRKEGRIISWGQKNTWRGGDFFSPLRAEFNNVSLVLEHDADAGAIGEAYFGAGINYSMFGYVTLSSGIGGALIENKKPSSVSVNNEVGHQIVNFEESETWSCGQKGCWESYASGTAFYKKFNIK